LNRTGPHIDRAFQYKVCINLDRRPDRLRRMRSRFASRGITGVERFAAIDGEGLIVPPGFLASRGAYGCIQSHMAVVRKAREAGAPDVLIFEDDAFFVRGFDQRFPRYMEQIPEDWDILYLGGNHASEPIAVSRNVVRVTGTLTSHAYAARNTIYDHFIECNERLLDVLDVNIIQLQKVFRCYCFRPNLVGQEQGLSDISYMKAWRWI
jgi:glycosyl transferase family 25